jgi:hypothetical protein
VWRVGYVGAILAAADIGQRRELVPPQSRGGTPGDGQFVLIMLDIPSTRNKS